MGIYLLGFLKKTVDWKLEFGAAAEGHGENGEYVYLRIFSLVRHQLAPGQCPALLDFPARAYLAGPSPPHHLHVRERLGLITCKPPGRLFLLQSIKKVCGNRFIRMVNPRSAHLMQKMGS